MINKRIYFIFKSGCLGNLIVSNRECLVCQQRINRKEHISFCGGIIEHLRRDQRIQHLPTDVETSTRQIESTLAHFEELDCFTARPVIHALASSILAAVTSAFGTNFRL